MLSFKRPHKGVVSLAAIAVAVVVLLVAVPAWKVIKGLDLFPSDSKAKTEVVTLTADQQKAQDAEKARAAAQAAKDANDAKLAAVQKAKIDNVHGLIAGTGDALAKEKNPSVPVQVAIVLNADADRALDPLDQPKLDAMQKLVDQLTSQNAADKAAGQVQLDALNGQLAQEKANEASLKVEQKTLTTQVQQATAQANTLQSKVNDDAKALSNWASDNAGLLARIGHLTLWLGILIGMLILLHWVLPLLAIACPALAPAAKIGGAIISLPLHLLHTLEQKALAALHASAAAALATTQTQLASEVAAHAQTAQTLIAVALTPDVAPTAANEALVAKAAASITPPGAAAAAVVKPAAPTPVPSLAAPAPVIPTKSVPPAAVPPATHSATTTIASTPAVEPTIPAKTT